MWWLLFAWKLQKMEMESNNNSFMWIMPVKCAVHTHTYYFPHVLKRFTINDGTWTTQRTYVRYRRRRQQQQQLHVLNHSQFQFWLLAIAPAAIYNCYLIHSHGNMQLTHCIHLHDALLYSMVNCLHFLLLVLLVSVSYFGIDYCCSFKSKKRTQSIHFAFG